MFAQWSSREKSNFMCLFVAFESYIAQGRGTAAATGTTAADT